MNNIPYGFQCPLLAQKKILEIFSSSHQSNKNCVTIDANPCKDTMTNISTIPLFHRDLQAFCGRDHYIPIQDLKELLEREPLKESTKKTNF